MSSTESSSQTPVSATERFELLAEQFYRETGIMAPGKSAPLGMYCPDEDERHRAWSEWLAWKRLEAR